MRTPIRPLLLAAAAGCCVGAVGQTVYRCDSPGVSPVFQQRPCERGGRPIDATPRNTLPVDPVTARVLARERDGGLSESEALLRYGRPTVTNTDRVGGSVLHQHVWRYADGSRRDVRTRDGVVTAISERPATAPRPGLRCHGEQDIRNERVSAGSLTLGPQQRAERERRIAEMERCLR